MLLRKTLIIFCLIVFFINSQFSSQKDEITTSETVSIVNVEVPVRVYYKGKPVDNLTKNDFKIFEGKKLQKIHEFNIKRKKIKIQKLELSAEQKQSYAPRYFVLAFQLTHFHDNFKRGLDCLFNSILMEGDQLMLVVNDKRFFINTLKNKSEVLERMKEIIKVESKKKRDQMTVYLKQIENEINISKLKLALREIKTQFGSNSSPLNKFLTKYLEIWNTYKQRYLIPNIDNYLYFSKHLEKIKMDKWVINFHQMELFPKIVLPEEIIRKIKQLTEDWQSNIGININLYKWALKISRQRVDKFAIIISRQLAEIEKVMKIATDFPAEEVSKLLYKANATFHTIFLRTINPSLAQNLQYKQVSSDLENSLRDISKRTGGTLIRSNKLGKALDTISEEEDICYMLTYAPENPNRVGKLKIKVNKKSHKLVYDNTIRAGFIKEYEAKKVIKGPAVKIDDMIFKNNQLTVIISNFYIGKSKKGRHGKLNIRIQIKNRQGIEIFDQNKNLNARQKIIKLSLNFPEIKNGTYNIVVDVKDEFTNKTATDLLQVEIK